MKKLFLGTLLTILFSSILFARLATFSKNAVKIDYISLENQIVINNENYILSPHVKVYNFNNAPISVNELKINDIVNIKYKTGKPSEEFPYPKNSKVIFYIKKLKKIKRFIRKN